MKKYLLLLLLPIMGFSQEVKQSDYKHVANITGQIEIDGHFVKDFIILETTLSGVKIYDRDSKKEYTYRKCSKDKCLIIHLESKNNGLIQFPNNNWTITPN
jgi:hypothetical protein